mmetsp:Transcript_43507/g.132396  ORF Transcript_43507/g.132396 Transcript_43507/m.132396 type:complete len:294 (-) Transcript_43507:260-1141(-)
MGSTEKSVNTSSHGLPNSFVTISFARVPLKPGTSSCSVFNASMISSGSTSVRVLATCASFTNDGPSLRHPSRMNSPASILAALISSSVAPFFRSLRAPNTLNTELSVNFHTSALRLSDDELPRFSQPFSRNSPSGTSSMTDSPNISSDADTSTPVASPVLTIPRVRLITPLSLSLASANLPISVQISSSIGHSSSMSSSTISSDSASIASNKAFSSISRRDSNSSFSATVAIATSTLGRLGPCREDPSDAGGTKTPAPDFWTTNPWETLRAEVTQRRVEAGTRMILVSCSTRL